jgi:hypothetical protein
VRGGIPLGDTLAAGVKDELGCRAVGHRPHPLIKSIIHVGGRVAAVNRGWMSEKIPPPAGQEKCFYLTSPFIEPARQLKESRGSGKNLLSQ